MLCSCCGAPFEGQFCPACGGVRGAAIAHGSAVDSLVGLRCGGYLADVVPAMVVSFAFSFLPLAGTALVGGVLLAYWLLRDISGASLGKHLLGLKVVRKDGSESGARERILRNVTLIAGPIFVMIPLAGMITGPMVAIGITLLEIVFLFTRKERLGDILAGTAVVRK